MSLRSCGLQCAVVRDVIHVGAWSKCCPCRQQVEVPNQEGQTALMLAARAWSLALPDWPGMSGSAAALPVDARATGPARPDL